MHICYKERGSCRSKAGGARQPREEQGKLGMDSIAEVGKEGERGRHRTNKQIEGKRNRLGRTTQGHYRPLRIIHMFQTGD